MGASGISHIWLELCNEIQIGSWPTKMFFIRLSSQWVSVSPSGGWEPRSQRNPAQGLRVVSVCISAGTCRQLASLEFSAFLLGLGSAQVPPILAWQTVDKRAQEFQGSRRSTLSLRHSASMGYTGEWQVSRKVRVKVGSLSAPRGTGCRWASPVWAVRRELSGDF